jgi:dTDP-4-amino-4,6-dideoxygalactose transaminase
METRINLTFNRPVIVGKELQYMAEAVKVGKLSGDGPFTKKCNALLEKELGVKKILLTTSCTHALEMMPILLDFQPGDEVILPSFTFVSTVNAFVLRGAKPVFADIRKDTQNLDESRLESLITQHTKAIIPVHYAGVGCEMDTILEIATRHGIPVVEDNAHGLFGKYKSRYLGTFGVLAAQSFHETKNFSCGEGGALLINDPSLSERAEIIREKGTNRSRFFRGQVDKYTWVDIGSSYLPSDILAAFLYAQLENRAKIQSHRKKIWEYYDAGLRDWAAVHEVQLPYIPPHCEQAYHMYYILLPSLLECGIQSVFHYLPLHLSTMGVGFGGKPGDCPVTECVSDRLVRIPFHNALTEIDQQIVLDAIMQFNF